MGFNLAFKELITADLCYFVNKKWSMPYGNDIRILRYAKENAAGEVRHIKWVQAGFK
jgi:hypothetical protein